MPEVGVETAFSIFGKYAPSDTLEGLLHGIVQGRRLYGGGVERIYSFLDFQKSVQLFYCQYPNEEEEILSSPYVHALCLIYNKGQVIEIPPYLQKEFEAATRGNIEVEAPSLEEAREQAKSQIPEGFHVVSEKVISDGMPKTIKAVAETTEVAFTKAQGYIPSNTDVIETDVTEITPPKRRVIRIEAFDEQSARALIEGKIVANEIIKNFKLVVPGAEGFLGFGKKPNQYEADVLQQAVVQITFRTKAKISVRLG